MLQAVDVPCAWGSLSRMGGAINGMAGQDGSEMLTAGAKHAALPTQSGPQTSIVTAALVHARFHSCIAVKALWFRARLLPERRQPFPLPSLCRPSLAVSLYTPLLCHHQPVPLYLAWRTCLLPQVSNDMGKEDKINLDLSIKFPY